MALTDPDFDENGRPLPKEYKKIIMKPYNGFGIALEEKNFVVFRVVRGVQYFEAYCTSIDGALFQVYKNVMTSKVLSKAPKEGYELMELLIAIREINTSFKKITRTWEI